MSNIFDYVRNNSFKFTLFKAESTSSSVDKFYDHLQNRGPLIEGSYVHFTIVLSHYLYHSIHLVIFNCIILNFFSYFILLHYVFIHVFICF